MNTTDITAALDAANIRHTPEAVALLAECNAPAIDYEQYREAVEAGYIAQSTPGHRFREKDMNQHIDVLIAAHAKMPETKAMQARIAELEAAVDQLERCMALIPEEMRPNTTNARALIAKPDPDGWIDWHGGECPVWGDVMVEVMLRNGDINISRARFWTWKRASAEYSHDIIAYRVLP